MRFQFPLAKGAERAITVSRTRHIDLTHNSASDPTSPFSFGNAANLRDFAHKLVPRRAAGIMIFAAHLGTSLWGKSRRFAPFPNENGLVGPDSEWWVRAMGPVQLTVIAACAPFASG